MFETHIMLFFIQFCITGYFKHGICTLDGSFSSSFLGKPSNRANSKLQKVKVVKKTYEVKMF